MRANEGPVTRFEWFVLGVVVVGILTLGLCRSPRAGTPLPHATALWLEAPAVLEGAWAGEELPEWAPVWQGWEWPKQYWVLPGEEI